MLYVGLWERKVMQASELRIGNSIENEYLNVDLGMEVWIVVKVDYHILYDLVHDESKKYRPIALTEQWLLDFGFEKHVTAASVYVKGNKALSTLDGKFRFIQGNFVCQLVLAELQYVHQLQNLFYALTGEELTLKEKV